MITLASNLDFTGSRFLAGLTAVSVARLRQAPAWWRDNITSTPDFRRAVSALFADGLFRTADPFLNFAGFLLRFP